MKNYVQISVLAFCFILLLANASAITQHDSIKVFAVSDNDQTAMAAELTLSIEKGTGKIWTDIEPLIGTSTQTTQRTAVQVAKNYFSDVASYDYKFDIDSDASLVDGPSAGAAMGLLTISMLTDRDIPDTVAVTGTITTEGGIGQVGGVFKKAQEAARIGIKLFLIPNGDAKQIVKTDSAVESVNLVDYAQTNWGMKVIEVSNIDQALRLAFSDIQSLDVNVHSQMPEFIPKPIASADSLEKMRDLTAKYLKEAGDSVKDAKTSLSGTLINEPAVIDVLLAALNSSEDSLQKGKILFDSNYFYSAANYAFLSKVNSSFVRDLSTSPELADAATTALDLKLLELKRNIEALKKDMNAFVPIENWEWYAASQQRLSWAEYTVDSLMANDIITVNTNGVSANAVENALDYEFAVAWAEVAKDFFDLSNNSSQKIVAPKPMFGAEINNYISGTEKAMDYADKSAMEDVAMRIAAAKNERAMGWSTAALFDSAAAFALVNAELFADEGKSLDELDFALKEKISGLDAALSSGNDYVWARLYLDHAKYYSQGVDFYREQGLNAQALEMAKSGIALAFLSGEMFTVSSIADNYYSSIPQDELFDNKGIAQAYVLDPIFFAYLLAVISIIAAVLLFLRFSGFGSGLNSTEKARFRADRLFADKKISHQKYLEINSILASRQQELGRDKEALSQSTVAMDTMRFELEALQKVLRELELQNKKGIVTKKDFEKNVSQLKQRIAMLKTRVKSHESDIAAEKKRIAADIQQYKKEFKQFFEDVKAGKKSQPWKKLKLGAKKD